MTDNTNNLDIAQRIAEALSRTTVARPMGGTMKAGSEVIGSVPEHLRHLNNLVDEMGVETVALESAFHKKRKQFDIVRAVLFNSLKTHVTEPENASGITILDNWDVAANFSSEDEDAGGLAGFVDIFDMIMPGRRR